MVLCNFWRAVPFCQNFHIAEFTQRHGTLKGRWPVDLAADKHRPKRREHIFARNHFLNGNLSRRCFRRMGRYLLRAYLHP